MIENSSKVKERFIFQEEKVKAALKLRNASCSKVQKPGTL
jgi:hypothetical protein